MSSVEERFQAAVNVIKGLPKNGPYQPSTTMMLEFYGLFKQATKGPCCEKKPAFWDVYGRAKWDAWQKRRNLSQQQAMQQYVDCLQRIIETMSYTENVQNFVGSLSDLESINLDELDKVMPGMKELAESHPNSPFNTRQNSPQHLANDTSEQDKEFRIPDETASSAAPRMEELGNQSADYSDLTTTQSDDEYVDPFDMQNDLAETLLLHTELLKQMQSTMVRMNADVHLISQRLATLEGLLAAISRQRRNSRCPSTMSLMRPDNGRVDRWWPFASISPQWFVILLLWPFVAKRLLRMWSRSRSSR